jgi:hypothetical protein
VEYRPEVARKFCPACNKLNAGSAAQCTCGQTFEAKAIVASRRTTKDCPACRQDLPRLTQFCLCGHEFEDVRELRGELEEQVRIGWSNVALGVIGLAIFVALMFYTSFLLMLGCFGCAALAVRGVLTRSDALTQLRAIDTAVSALPLAKIVR